MLPDSVCYDCGMTKKDNPLRLLRLQAGLTQTELARRAGIHRASLVAIEEGRTRTPSEATLGALSRHLAFSEAQLATDLQVWLAKQSPSWDHRQRAVLAQSAAAVTTHYSSFAGWRQDLGLPVHRFAAAIGVSRSTVLEFEAGLRTGGMPDTMMSGLLRLGLPTDVVLALAALPPSDRDDDEES